MGSCSPFHTPLGIGLVYVNERGICRVELPPSADSGGFTVGSQLSRRASRLLERYFNGERIEFALPCDLSGLPPFRQRILRLAAEIGYGTVLSYGDLAQQAGCPAAARAVGGAMAANPIPIIIPCHRVVAASGWLTGYSAPGGLIMKRYLLSMERVDFRGDSNKVKIDCFAQKLFIKK